MQTRRSSWLRRKAPVAGARPGGIVSPPQTGATGQVRPPGVGGTGLLQRAGCNGLEAAFMMLVGTGAFFGVAMSRSVRGVDVPLRAVLGLLVVVMRRTRTGVHNCTAPSPDFLTTGAA